MGIGKRIKEARVSLNLTQEELSNIIGVTKGAIANYENETSHPKEPILYKLIDTLQVDANYLFQDVVNIPKKVNDVTLAEFEIIKKYRQIKPHEKEMVDTVLNIAYKEYERLEKIKADRVMEQQASYLCSPAERNYPEGIYQIDDFKNEEEGRISVPVYDFGVSAGTGVFLDNPCYEVVSMPEDALSRKANFALWVTGDSMEPRFHDGDLVLVKIQPSVDIGEVGIFVLNGEGYIKKWGGNKLISLNSAYEPIMLTEDDALYCKGKVLGSVRNS